MKKEKVKKPRPTLRNKMQGVLNFSDYRKTSNKVGYGFIIGFLVIFSLIAIMPLVYLFFTSMKTVAEINSTDYHFFPQHFTFQKIIDLWQKVNFTNYYLNTFLMVIGCVVCAVVFNSMLAYATTVIKPFGYKVIDKLILLGYMIPSILNIVPLFLQISQMGLTNPDLGYLTMLSLWLSYGANAYYYMLFKDHFAKIPQSLIEAARMDGYGDMGIFLKVALPLSKSIIGIVAIFAMTASYSDFLLPYLVLGNGSLQTLMVGIYNMSSETLDESEFLLVLVLSIIPQVIMFLIFQKQIMGSNAQSGMKE